MRVFFHEAFYQVYPREPAAAAGRMEAVVAAIENFGDSALSASRISGRAASTILIGKHAGRGRTPRRDR